MLGVFYLSNRGSPFGFFPFITEQSAKSFTVVSLLEELQFAKPFRTVRHAAFPLKLHLTIWLRYFGASFFRIENWKVQWDYLTIKCAM